MRLIFALYLLSLTKFTACRSKESSTPLHIGKWKSVSDGSDIDIIDSTRFHMLLRNDDGTIDSITWYYKLQGKRFEIYTHAFLASENKILTLTNDSFIYARPHDLDTFRYVRMK